MYKFLCVQSFSYTVAFQLFSKMTAIHRELVYYLCDTLEKENRKGNILIIGKDAEVITSLLSNGYTAEGIVDPSDKLRDLPPEKYDAVIVNDLFLNFTIAQVEELLNALLKTIKIGGYVEIRLYLHDAKWNLAQYTNLFDCYRVNDDSGNKSLGFKVVWEQGLRDTIYSKHDWKDHCWLLTKGQFQPITSAKHAVTVRDYLDRYQYTDHGIRKYEWIFGHGFLSPGGEVQNADFLSQLRLKPGDTVLDIGCGIGGNAFQIAKIYGAEVIGVDLSSNAVAIACDRASLKQDTRVRFLIADITSMDFPADSFEVVYSRDTILHIPEKASLFQKIHKWLKPGGLALITDYMRSDKPDQTDRFQKYVADRQYTLWSLRQYVDSAEKAGFHLVHGLDITEQFKMIIQAEVDRAQENKQEFLQQFTENEYDHLIEGWKNKLEYIADGDLKWGLLKAEKATAKE